MNTTRSLRKPLAICLALLCSAASATGSHTDVINGTITKAWPGMGAILISQGTSFFQCSGTLIAPNWVLTAAHCLDASGTVTFTMDRDYLSPVAIYYTADATYVHPNHNHNDSSSPYDAGLAHFATPIPAMPFRLNDSANLVEVGDRVQFIGYGDTENGSNSIRRIGLTTISALDMHGMGSQSGAYPCFGDSGSAWFALNTDGFPLVVSVQSYLVGQNCNNFSYADAIPDVLPFISSHVPDLCLLSTVGAPCDGIFRSNLEAAP